MYQQQTILSNIFKLSFTVVLKNIKYLVINLTRDMQNLYIGHYEHD